MVLRAAFRNPKYEKITLEFSKRKRRVKIEDIVAAIQEQQLLLDHLKKEPEKFKSSDPEVRVKAAKTPQKPCFAFQKGNCTRADCPFVHEKEKLKPKYKPLPCPPSCVSAVHSYVH